MSEDALTNTVTITSVEPIVGFKLDWSGVVEGWYMRLSDGRRWFHVGDPPNVGDEWPH